MNIKKGTYYETQFRNAKDKLIELRMSAQFNKFLQLDLFTALCWCDDSRFPITAHLFRDVAYQARPDVIKAHVWRNGKATRRLPGGHSRHGSETPFFGRRPKMRSEVYFDLGSTERSIAEVRFRRQNQRLCQEAKMRFNSATRLGQWAQRFALSDIDG